MYIIKTLFVHSIFIDQFLIFLIMKQGGKITQKILFQKQFKDNWLHWKKHKKLHSHNLVGNIETNTDQHYKL